MHIGDEDFDINDPAFTQDATWGEVCSACCVHTPEEWGRGFGCIVLALTFLYFFLFGLELLGSGAKFLFSDET